VESLKGGNCLPKQVHSRPEHTKLHAWLAWHKRPVTHKKNEPVLTAAVFVRRIVTVHHIVAHCFRRYALLVGTLELIRFTGLLWFCPAICKTSNTRVENTVQKTISENEKKMEKKSESIHIQKK
jgi:hypothetical protein